MPWTISDTGRGMAITLQSTFESLDGAEVKWGWTEDSADYPDGTSIHEVAATHHFGATIENGFGRGILIVIPARPILTETFEHNAEQIGVLSDAINDEIIDTMTTDIEAGLRVIGQFAQSNMQRDFRRLQAELVPLADSTIRRKGQEDRLIESGHLMEQVLFKVET